MGPLVSVLERAEELNLPTLAIGAIQTALQLMGNANQHNSIARRNALLMQLNPQLKQLVEDVDFKEAPPFLFGKNFGTLAKERIEVAAALTKTLGLDKGRQGFQKSHPQRNRGRGVAPNTVAITTDREDGKPIQAKPAAQSSSHQRNDN